MKQKMLTLLLVIVILFSFISTTTSAHEYSKPLRWIPSTNGFAYLRVSYGGLPADSVYQNNLFSMRNGINNSTAKILISEVSSNNNLHITSTTWDKWMYTYGISEDAAAQTFAYDTNGVEVRDNATSLNSNGKLDYAVIFINPNSTIPYDELIVKRYPQSESGQTHVLIHEVGHVLGLMHCTCSSTSIMKSGIPTSGGTYYTAFTSHDNACLIAYYGS